VFLKALLAVIDQHGEAKLDHVVAAFRAFYVARKQAGLAVEYGPPDPSDTQALNDAQLRQLIIKNPLERFLIKGFLDYAAEQGIVRFAPQLWGELRYWELLAIQQSANDQLAYYYNRAR
jgi:hypothetical protein